MIKTLIERHDLILLLAKREIKQRYKQSLLGYAWVLVTPLITMLVFTLIFTQFIHIENTGVPYPIFVYLGILCWNFFSTSLSTATMALVTNANLITKTYFPREVLVYATVLAKLFDLLLASIIFVVFLFLYNMHISLTLLWLPFLLLILVLFTMGLSLLFASLNLFYRDIGNMLSVLLMVWMYVTPIMYPLEIVPVKYQFYLSLNPLTPLVNGFRSVVLYNRQPEFNGLFLASVLSCILFVTGFLIFKKLEHVFADTI